MPRFLEVKSTSNRKYIINIDKIIFYSPNREGVTNVRMQDDYTIEVDMDIGKFDEELKFILYRS